MSNTGRRLPHIILVVLVGLLAYWNSFDASFHFDDFHNIADNRIIKDLRYFLDTSEAEDFYMYDSLRNRYVGYLSFALNYRISGLDVRGFHITNLAIHILNGVMVYLLVILVFRTPFMEGSRLRDRSGLIAFFSALLFVSHPIQTQAVTYIVQRFASLTAMFYLLSTVSYIAFRLTESRKRRSILYVLALLSAVLAMKTKQIAFTLPIAVSLCEFSFFRTSLRKRALYLVPLFLTVLLIPLSVIDLDKPIGETMGELDEFPRTEEISVYDYLLTEFRVVVTYLRLLVLPINQNLYYDYPTYHSLVDPQVLLSFLLLMSLFLLGVLLYFRSRNTHNESRLVAFGIFWFFLALSVESSIIPLYPIYEHRLYLPSVGFIMACVSGVFMLSMGRARMQKAAMVFFIVLTAAFTLATHTRNNIWMNEISLWQDGVKKSPHKARTQNNLCNAYIDEGLLERGIEHCQKAIGLDPEFFRAHNNLGRAYLSLGLRDEAISLFREALRLRPYYVMAHCNLGAAYIDKGLYDMAIDELLKALELDPLHATSYLNLGIAYQEKGFLDEAIRQYQAAIKYRPGYKKAHLALEMAYMKKGRYQEDEEHMRKAME
jgi:tetratricopeptide (TPR) repeat protein